MLTSACVAALFPPVAQESSHAPPRLMRTFPCAMFALSPKDLWDVHVTMESLRYCMCDSAAAKRAGLRYDATMGPSVLGALSFGNCDVHVRLPWQQNTTCEAQLMLHALHAPPNAHMPIDAFESEVSRPPSYLSRREASELDRFLYPCVPRLHQGARTHGLPLCRRFCVHQGRTR